MMRTGNPALNKKTFKDTYATGERPQTMTIMGTVHKTALLLIILVITAAFTWKMTFAAQDPGTLYPWMIGGSIGGLVLALIIIFKKTMAPLLSPLYAAAEGLFVGAFSAFMERLYPGIVIQAVGLTFGTLFMLLLAYRSGLIKVTANFRLGIVAATGGIFMIYMISWIMRMFGTTIPYIHESGLIGIGFSLFVVVIAALNLVLDFDFIESGADQGAPKYMEWYGAFGLMVTLIWLYIEILRLLAKLRGRR